MLRPTCDPVIPVLRWIWVEADRSASLEMVAELDCNSRLGNVERKGRML